MKNNKLLPYGILGVLGVIAIWRIIATQKNKNTTTSNPNPNTTPGGGNAAPPPQNNYADVEKTADAINFITNQTNGCSAYGIDATQWCNKISQMNDDQINHLVTYWNDKYYNTNGQTTYGVFGLDLPFGGQRTISKAIDALFCALWDSIDCLTCDAKTAALTKLNNR